MVRHHCNSVLHGGVLPVTAKACRNRGAIMAEIVQSQVPIKITLAEVCRLLSVSRDTVDALRQRPGFPRCYRYTDQGRIYFDRAEILNWLESRREPQGGEDRRKGGADVKDEN
jgi:predicted DNA-binding transcriptional regulator AlpA